MPAMTHIAPDFDRIRAHTPPQVTDRIDAVAHHQFDQAVAGGRDAIVRRLAELEREWDLDRAVMANFAVLGGLNLAFGSRGRRGLLALLGVQMGFLLLHSLAGWCPPSAVFRRLGFRSRQEIDAERHELLQHLESPRLG